jgi:hypothetical protein
MADSHNQATVMKRAETVLERYADASMQEIELKLSELGFIQRNADPVVLVMEHPEAELFLEIEIDEDGHLHGYELLPLDELDEKQEKFRW